MPVRTLFISHSSKDDPAAQARLKAIVERLEETPGYKAWYDQRDLSFGDQWYPNVANNLAGCHAGLLLLDQPALDSPYVQHEASVLGNRVYTERIWFRLFVVILDPSLSRTKLRDGPLNAARIAEEQIWRPTAAELVDNQTLAIALRKQVEERLGNPVFDDTRRDRIARLIQGILGEIESKLPDALEDALTAARQQGEPVPELEILLSRIRGAPRYQLVSRWMVAQAANDLAAMSAFLEALALYSPDHCGRLVSMVQAAEAYWLGESVEWCPICHATARHATGGGVAINGQYVCYTARCYAHRALSPDRRFRFIRCDDKSSVAEVRIAIKEYFQNEEVSKRPISEQGIRDRIAQGIATLCLLPPMMLIGTEEKPLLDKLQKDFGPVVFVLQPGTTIVKADLPDNVAVVEPPVDPEMEAVRFKAWVGTANKFGVRDECGSCL
jgi:TIR domain